MSIPRAPSPQIESALSNAEIAPDERGLMPIAAAREVLATATAYDRDNGDVLWAALLSLGDVDELRAATKRLEWRHHPRGRDNTALVERYGEALSAWLADRVVDGVLVNLPWCIEPCLLALSSAATFEILWDLWGYNDTADMQRWTLVPPSELEDEELEERSDNLLARWCQRHPRAATAELAHRAQAGDERAGAWLQERAARAPAATLALLGEILGVAAADALATELELARSLTVEGILDHLDEAAASDWPQFNYVADGRIEYFGMRLVACRSRTGDGWGVVLERVTGSYPDMLRVERFGYGSALSVAEPSLEADYRELEFEGDDLFHGGTIEGPAGTLVLDEGLIDEHDLRPGMCCEVGYWPFRVLLIRAYLAVYPDALFGAPEATAALLGIDDPEVLIVSDAFHHVIGNGRQGVPDQPWEVDPSESETYCSLARAIVERDATQFVPGESNLDFRLHAYVEQPCALPWHDWRFPPDERRSHVDAALMEAAVDDRDDRGLMPLAEAEELVEKSRIFGKERGERVGELHVQPQDRLWAALLSLADGEAFARAASGLTWRDDPRGSPKNLGPVERYGVGIVPWFEAMRDEAGVLHNRPRCLADNLLALAAPEVADLLVTLEGLSDAESAGSASSQLASTIFAWHSAHPTTAYPRLAQLARAGNTRAASVLRDAALLEHEAVWAALGDDAEAAYALVGAPRELSPDRILAQLDRAAAGAASDFDAWPRFCCGSYPGAAEYHGMRLIGARSDTAWGVVIERLTGYGRQARIVRFHYGPTRRGHEETHDTPILFDVSTLTGPAGALEPDAEVPAGAELFTEPPDYWAIREAPAWVCAFRAYLARHPDAFWAEPESLLAPLDLGPNPKVVVVASAFEHAAGPERTSPDDAPQAWHRLPSNSPAYRTLAERLVDPSAAIDLGTANTEWCHHAHFAVDD